jgi:hypothetical protein
MQIIFSQCIITNVQKGRGEAAVVAAATVYVGRPCVGMSFWAKVVRCRDCSADVSNCLRTCAVSLGVRGAHLDKFTRYAFSHGT